MRKFLAKGIALNFTGTVPEWITVLPKGPLVVGRDGREFIVRDAAAVVNAFNSGGIDIPVDINHATEIRGSQGEEAPAAGWIQEMRVGAEGQIEARVDWTESGRQAVASRGYRYLSPALNYRKVTREVAAITSVALVTHPNLAALPALNQSQASIMDEEQLNQLRARLGLQADATPEAILAEAQNATALCSALGVKEVSLANALNAVKALDLSPLRQELGLKEGEGLDKALNAIQQLKQGEGGNKPDLEKYVPRADFDAMKDQLEKSLNRVSALENSSRDAEIETEIEQALNCGQITPATADFYRDYCKAEGGLEKFRSFVKSAPAVAAPSSLKGEPPSLALNQRNPVLAEAFGNSAEDVKKYGA